MNQNGWGLKDFILLVAIMFIALIITMFVYQKDIKTLFSGSVEENKKTYHDLELELKVAAQKYQNVNYQGNIESMETIVLPYKLLKENKYIDKITDIKNSSECDGYVKFIRHQAQIDYEPYIKCSNYKTKGFNQTYIKN